MVTWVCMIQKLYFGPHIMGHHGTWLRGQGQLMANLDMSTWWVRVYLTNEVLNDVEVTITTSNMKWCITTQERMKGRSIQLLETSLVLRLHIPSPVYFNERERDCMVVNLTWPRQHPDRWLVYKGTSALAAHIKLCVAHVASAPGSTLSVAHTYCTEH